MTLQLRAALLVLAAAAGVLGQDQCGESPRGRIGLSDDKSTLLVCPPAGGDVYIKGVSEALSDYETKLSDALEDLDALERRICLPGAWSFTRGMPSNVPSDAAAFSNIVMAKNGFAYAIPRSAPSVIVIDPESRATIATMFDRDTEDRYTAGVEAPNGKIYVPPLHANRVLVIDTLTNTLGTITTVSGSYKWGSPALAPNGKIYATPIWSTTILVINPATDTVDYVTVPGLVAESSAFASAGAGSNGKIYLAPAQTDHILIFDPETNSFDSTTLKLSVSGNYKYGSTLTAPDGTIYMMPNWANHILAINTTTNTYNQITIPGADKITAKWRLAQFASNGRIYAPPFEAQTILEFDPLTRVVRQHALSFTPAENAFSQIIQDPVTGTFIMSPEYHSHFYFAQRACRSSTGV